MGSSSDSITPNTVIYIILLNELNEGSDIEINQSLSKFLIDRILVKLITFFNFRAKKSGETSRTSSKMQKKISKLLTSPKLLEKE